MTTRIQIRQSVFETTSSSSHSLTLGENILNFPLPRVVPGGTYVILFGDYGWEDGLLDNWEEKLQYLMTDAMLCYTHEMAEPLLDIVKQPPSTEQFRKLTDYILSGNPMFHSERPENQGLMDFRNKLVPEKVACIIDILKGYLGYDEVLISYEQVCENSYRYNAFGDIDHESVGTTSEVWDMDVHGIAGFLFGDSFIELGNDND